MSIFVTSVMFPSCLQNNSEVNAFIGWSGRFTELGRTGLDRQLCTPVMQLRCFNIRNDGLLSQYNAILDFTNIVLSIKMKAIQSWLWRIRGITAWHLRKSCHCCLCCFFVTSTRSHCPLCILLLTPSFLEDVQITTVIIHLILLSLRTYTIFSPSTALSLRPL
jgi:hypothetical protein